MTAEHFNGAPGNPFPFPVCGVDGWAIHVHLTTDPTKVTCKRCLAHRVMRAERDRRTNEQQKVTPP